MITGTNFLAWSVVRPSLPKPPTMVAMSPALPPMAPARPPSKPPSPPPRCGRLLHEIAEPGHAAEQLVEFVAAEFVLRGLEQHRRAAFGLRAADAEILGQQVDELFHGGILVVSVVRRRGETIGAFAPRRPHQRHFADRDVGFARRHFDGAQRDGARRRASLSSRATSASTSRCVSSRRCCSTSMLSSARATSCDSRPMRVAERAAVPTRPTLVAEMALRPSNAPRIELPMLNRGLHLLLRELALLALAPIFGAADLVLQLL